MGELADLSDEVGEGGGSHFSHDVGSMEFDGFLADAEVGGDNFVGFSVDDEGENLSLAWGQGGESVADAGEPEGIGSSLGVAGEGPS